MPKNTVVIEINFNLNEPDKTIIRTNAKKMAIAGILEVWLSCQSVQCGQCEDKSAPNEKNKYKIVIQLDLNDDTFLIKSDTGNEGLTYGIIINTLGRLNKITTTDLS